MPPTKKALAKLFQPSFELKASGTLGTVTLAIALEGLLFASQDRQAVRITTSPIAPSKPAKLPLGPLRSGPSLAKGPNNK